jgi:hypothetical protein
MKLRIRNDTAKFSDQKIDATQKVFQQVVIEM